MPVVVSSKARCRRRGRLPVRVTVMRFLKAISPITVPHESPPAVQLVAGWSPLAAESFDRRLHVQGAYCSTPIGQTRDKRFLRGTSMTSDMHSIYCPPARAAGSGVRASALAAFIIPLLTTDLTLAAQPVKVCSGTLSASPLRPAAKPLVVELAHPIDSVANPGLAKAFLDGVQNAGATVVLKGQGTTTLDLSFLMRNTGGGERRNTGT
jgi:hypothetical protein